MKTPDSYPMEHSCSDAARFYLKLRNEQQQLMKQIKLTEEEFKHQLSANKQQFESSLHKKRKTLYSHPIHTKSTLPLELPLREHEQGIITPTKSGEKRFKHVVPRPECFHPSGAVLNHCRASCPTQPRICRHIKQISQDYRVIYTAQTNLLDFLESREYITTLPELMLVPLHEPCPEPVVEKELQELAASVTAQEPKRTSIRVSLPDANTVMQVH